MTKASSRLLAPPHASSAYSRCLPFYLSGGRREAVINTSRPRLPRPLRPSPPIKRRIDPNRCQERETLLLFLLLLFQRSCYLWLSLRPPAGGSGWQRLGDWPRQAGCKLRREREAMGLPEEPEAPKMIFLGLKMWRRQKITWKPFRCASRLPPPSPFHGMTNCSSGLLPSHLEEKIKVKLQEDFSLIFFIHFYSLRLALRKYCLQFGAKAFVC